MSGAESGGGYEGMARDYALLFPVSEALKGFLHPFADVCRARQRTCGAAWLDVGCGTGLLVEWLLGEGVDAWGIDPDRDFVREAVRRMNRPEVRIREGAMGSVRDFHVGGTEGRSETKCRGDAQWRGAAESASAEIGMITCLGNVLAHVADGDEIRAFFRNAAARLGPEGVLIAQTVNFDRVLSDPAWEFPVIRRPLPGEGGALIFERRYDLASWREGQSGGRIPFETTLRRGAVEVVRNRTLLYPARGDFLEQTAREFFVRVERFGDFARSPWSAASSPATILCAARPASTDKPD